MAYHAMPMFVMVVVMFVVMMIVILMISLSFCLDGLAMVNALKTC